MNPEILGFLASFIVLASFILRGEKKIRLVNILGALCFVVYGLMIHSWSVAFMNAALVLVHLFQFWNMAKDARHKKALAKASGKAAKIETDNNTVD